MATSTFTVKWIEGLKPGPTERWYWDQGQRGFGLRLNTRGEAWFVVQYRVKHTARRRRVALGRYGTLTLEEAKNRARRHLSAGLDGKDLHAEGQTRALRLTFIRRDGHRIATIEHFRTSGVEKILAHLPTGTRCFVSIDIDVLDMPLVPGCVSAEPDGLTYAELRGALKVIAERLDVAGFDLVEINPLLDVPTGATAYLGAHTIIEFLGHICAQPRWVERRNGRA